MTLTYEIDTDILPPDVHAKIQVRMSVPSAEIVRRTDTQTHTWCQNDNTHQVKDMGYKGNITGPMDPVLRVEYVLADDVSNGAFLLIGSILLLPKPLILFQILYKFGKIGKDEIWQDDPQDPVSCLLIVHQKEFIRFRSKI